MYSLILFSFCKTCKFTEIDSFLRLLLFNHYMTFKADVLRCFNIIVQHTSDKK